MAEEFLLSCVQPSQTETTPQTSVSSEDRKHVRKRPCSALDIRNLIGEGQSCKDNWLDSISATKESRLDDQVKVENAVDHIMPSWHSGDQTSQNMDINSRHRVCEVCGDRSSGRHYGVFSCDGCRGFFKRTIRCPVDFKCINENEQCRIDFNNRTRCPACRFKRCLQVGMLKEAVQEPRTPVVELISKQRKRKADDYDQKLPIHEFSQSVNHKIPRLRSRHSSQLCSTIPESHELFRVPISTYSIESQLSEHHSMRPLYIGSHFQYPFMQWPVFGMDLTNQVRFLDRISRERHRRLEETHIDSNHPHIGDEKGPTREDCSLDVNKGTRLLFRETSENQENFTNTLTNVNSHHRGLCVGLVEVVKKAVSRSMSTKNMSVNELHNVYALISKMSPILPLYKSDVRKETNENSSSMPSETSIIGNLIGQMSEGQVDELLDFVVHIAACLARNQQVELRILRQMWSGKPLDDVMTMAALLCICAMSSDVNNDANKPNSYPRDVAMTTKLGMPTRLQSLR